MAFAEERFKDNQWNELPLSPLSYVWRWFTELFLFGGYGMGPFKTPYSEIEAYSRVMGIYIRPLEARIIRDLGQLFVNHSARKKEQERSLPPGMKKLTPMSDASGIRALFEGRGETKPTGAKWNGHR